MAQKILTVCDPCLTDKDVETPARTWSVSITQPGAKPASYTLDVCDEHARPLAELSGYLSELGRPAAGKSSTGAATEPVERRTCRVCGHVSTTRSALGSHVRTVHSQSLTESEGGEANRVCPECGEAFASPQGYGVHRARKHGVRGESKASKARAEAKA